MGFFRSSVFGLGSLEAAVGLRSAEVVEAVTVDSNGDPELVTHLPGATWDKLLTNLAGSKDQQLDLLTRFGDMLVLAVDALNDEGSVTLAGMPLVKDAVRKPDVTVIVRLTGNFEGERLGATTKFKPFHRADAATGEAALWSLWDWTVQAMPDLDAYRAMLTNLVHQCDYYEYFGPPGRFDIGKASFYGAMKGTSDRLGDEMGARVGLTGDEFRALPKEERHRLMDDHEQQRSDDH